MLGKIFRKIFNHKKIYNRERGQELSLEEISLEPVILKPIFSAPPEITIAIGKIDLAKIFEFINAVYPTEITLKMLVKRTGNYFFLYEPLFFEQIGTDHSTDAKTETEFQIQLEWEKTLSPKDYNEKLSSVRAWIHSHPDIPFWSSKDNRTCNNYDNNDFFISIVFAIDRNTLLYNCRMDVFPPKKEKQKELDKINIYRPPRFTIYNLPLQVIDDMPKDFDYQKMKEEIKKLAKEKVEIAKSPRGQLDWEEEEDCYYDR